MLSRVPPNDLHGPPAASRRVDHRDRADLDQERGIGEAGDKREGDRGRVAAPAPDGGEVVHGPVQAAVAGTYQAIRELKDGTLVREPKPDAKKPTPGTKS